MKYRNECSTETEPSSSLSSKNSGYSLKPLGKHGFGAAQQGEWLKSNKTK